MCNTFINLDFKSFRFIDSYMHVIDPIIKEKYAKLDERVEYDAQAVNMLKMSNDEELKVKEIQ
jgi:hypothetical protein